MREFTVNRTEERNVLKVNIGKKSYEIPLSGSLKRGDLRKYDFASAEGTAAFMESYIPAEVLDDLTISEYNTIVKAWSEASNEANGISTGES